MKRIKTFFKTKTPEQTYSFILLIFSLLLMFLCAIARLAGILWFSADLSSVETPSRFWQEFISAALLIFELIFVYKILCRTKWSICFAIAIAEAAICLLIGYVTNGNQIATNIFTALCILLIPITFTRKWFSLVESIVLYFVSTLYGILFCVGRIGGLEIYNYNFVASVLGTIDYKLFIVSLYLLVKNFGGIRLWKTQKRLIFQEDLRT